GWCASSLTPPRDDGRAEALRYDGRAKALRYDGKAKALRYDLLALIRLRRLIRFADRDDAEDDASARQVLVGHALDVGGRDGERLLVLRLEVPRRPVEAGAVGEAERLAQIRLQAGRVAQLEPGR